MSFAPETETLAKPEALLRVPVGLASPLWGLFAGAAVSGATWWWMTQWARPQNLEAVFGAMEGPVAVEPEPAALAAPFVEALEAGETVVETVAETVAEAVPEPLIEMVAEVTPERVLEAVAEAAGGPVAQALMEADPFPEPVGGESAPISPVVAALAPDVVAETAPSIKPRKKPVAAAPATDDLAD